MRQVPVEVKGFEMLTADAVELIVREVAVRAQGGPHYAHLGQVMAEWVAPRSRFHLLDAFYQKTQGVRLN